MNSFCPTPKAINHAIARQKKADARTQRHPLHAPDDLRARVAALHRKLAQLNNDPILKKHGLKIRFCSTELVSVDVHAHCVISEDTA